MVPGADRRQSLMARNPGNLKARGGSTPNFVRVWRGDAKVWFYRNPSSIDVYVRTSAGDDKSGAAPICFRIPLQRI